MYYPKNVLVVRYCAFRKRRISRHDTANVKLFDGLSQHNVAADRF
jgi:hypothetical protein